MFCSLLPLCQSFCFLSLVMKGFELSWPPIRLQPTSVGDTNTTAPSDFSCLLPDEEKVSLLQSLPSQNRYFILNYSSSFVNLVAAFNDLSAPLTDNTPSKVHKLLYSSPCTALAHFFFPAAQWSEPYYNVKYALQQTEKKLQQVH